MAAVGRRLQVVTDGEATLLRQVDTVVDERTGLVQQRERIAYGVEDENGDMAVYVQDTVTAARVPTWVERSLSSQRPAITAGRTHHGYSSRSRSSQESVTSKDSLSLLFFKACCILFFLPCTSNYILLIAMQLLVWGASTAGVLFTVFGPFKCQNDNTYMYYIGSILTFVLIGTILAMSIYCCCAAVLSRRNNKEDSLTITYFFTCIAGLFFLVMLAAVSGVVFENWNELVTTSDCRFSVVFLCVVCFSYSLIVYILLGWCLCFVIVQRRK